MGIPKVSGRLPGGCPSSVRVSLDGLRQINVLRCRNFTIPFFSATTEMDMPADIAPAGVFEFLDATHVRIGQQLKRLRLLVDRIATDGLDQSAQAMARDVLDYFNTEARQHHLDEEKHVFPALLASHEPELVQAAERLTQDHGWLEENWLYIAPSIEAAADGNNWFDTTELSHALDVFEALYEDHIVLEESLAYPEARQRLAQTDKTGMGREMARRRALQKAQAEAR